jgi:CubicO group peptidase (beta-lactamase class C family)
MTITRRTFQAGLLSAASGVRPAQAETPAIAGTWSGLLEVGSQRLRLKLDVAADNTGRLISIDQGPQPYPGKVNARTAERVELEFATIRAVFAGRFIAPDRLEGEWRQGGGTYPLILRRGLAALEIPAPPSALTKERLAELRRAAGSPAMAAASARKGGPTRLWVDGERAVGSGIAAQESDLWHLGSISKSMTATLIGRLVDAGAVRWDDSVGDVLGDAAPDMDTAYRSATFRHLLSHRSGLPKDLAPAEFARFSRLLDDAREERKTFARLALAMPPKGPMGATYEYSNNGYVVAGAMLEARLGKSWEDLTREHLFAPLQLSSAGFGAPGHKDQTDQPVGHAKAPAGEGRQAYPIGGIVTDNPVALGPAGRIHMSLPDLLRYLGAHRDRTDYLKPDTWTTLHTPPFAGTYAMGWIVRGNGALTHAGSNTLWYAEVLVDPAAGIVAAAASNDGHMPKSSPAVGRALLEAAAAA